MSVRAVDRALRILPRAAAVAAVFAFMSGCGKAPASGRVDELVVVTSNEVWAALGQEIVTALQPSTLSVRRERIFEVAYLEPEDVAGSRLRRMRHVLLIGPAGDPLIEETVGHPPEASERPVIIQVRDVWALNQVVTVVVLPESAEPRALMALLPKIRDSLVRQLETAIRARVALAPPTKRLTEWLAREGGFTLRVPYSYDYEQPEPGLFVFRHEEWAAGTVVRTITVDSRARGAVAFTAGSAHRWREDLAGRLNQPRHVTDTLTRAVQGRVAGQRIVQVQGVWSTPPGEWPSAGPFLSRIVECPERVFLLDAWVYAPVDEKYEHLYRLDLTLDTFRCPTGGRGAGP